MRVKDLMPTLIAVVLTPLTIIAAMGFGSRSYYIASILVIVYAMIPFLASFESSRPSARLLVMLAAMCAIAIVSRIAFAWTPFIKPVGAFVAIAGIAFGARSGFLVGSMTMFASNLVFGQGPWTPWQMFAFGMLGLLAGLLADAGAIPRANLRPVARVLVSVGIGVTIMLVVGPLLDTSSLFLFSTEVDLGHAIAIYGAGLMPNAMQAVGASVTFLAIGNAALTKLDRICRKFGFRDGYGNHRARESNRYRSTIAPSDASDPNIMRPDGVERREHA